MKTTTSQLTTRPPTKDLSFPARATLTPVAQYKKSKNKLPVFSEPTEGLFEALADANAESTQKSATKWNVAKCCVRLVLIHRMKPTSAPTARNNHRRIKLSPENGIGVPANKKHPMVTGKNTLSNRHRQPTTISAIRIAPSVFELAKIPGLRTIHRKSPLPTTTPIGIRSNRS